MPLDPDRVMTLFNAASDLASTVDRSTLLDRECGDEPELRHHLETLLTAHDRPATVLEHPPSTVPGETSPAGDAAELIKERPAEDEKDRTTSFDGSAAQQRPASLEPGSPIGNLIAGRYLVRREIGEGGMGSVYLADQIQPVKRRVALKLIKPGMDTRTVLARFDSERQALAMMDHPHIAKVLDAGTTDQGHPFFVMELVDGLPLTEYCDQRRLGLPERLMLFQQVCSAVQHAHQKGIIHRDLKPTNILVEEHDGKPVPKVIDFGLAKATSGQTLTDESLTSASGSVAGTPMYMAPEQADLWAADVDTRADIYSLGVILYEILTGGTPILRGSLQNVSLTELLRRIREVEPPTPSHRIGSSEALPSIAAARQIEPVRLQRFIRGDLDWIVMKALAKERQRRYESAIGLAKDIARFLNHDPVEAGPPSRTYRVGKFARKHRAALGTIGAFVGLLIVAVGVSARLAIQERNARRMSQNRLNQVEKSNDLLASILVDLESSNETPDKPLRAVLAERLNHAAESLDARAIDDPLTLAKLQHLLGKAQTTLGNAAEAIPVLKRSLKTREALLGTDHTDVLDTRTVLAEAYLSVGRASDSIALLEDTRRRLEAKPEAGGQALIEVLGGLASSYHKVGRMTDAVATAEAALKRAGLVFGPNDEKLLKVRFLVIRLYLAVGRVGEAIAMSEANLKKDEVILGPSHKLILIEKDTLAAAYMTVGRTAEAVPLCEAAYSGSDAMYGPDHPMTVTMRNNLSKAYLNSGRGAEAVKLTETNLKRMEGKFGPDHPETLMVAGNLIATLMGVERNAEALALAKPTVKRMQAVLGVDHPTTLFHRDNLAQAYHRNKQTAEAIAILEKDLPLFQARMGDDHPETIHTRCDLVVFYRAVGRWADAIAMGESTLGRLLAKFPPDHPDVLSTRIQIARAFDGVGRIDQATAMDEETLRICQSRFGPDAPMTLEIRANLMSDYARANRMPEAIALNEATLKLREAKLGPDHADTIDTRRNLIQYYMFFGRQADALALAAAELKRIEAKFGPDHAATINARGTLASIYQDLGQLSEAIVMHEANLKQIEAKRGSLDQDALGARVELGRALLSAGQPARAETVVRTLVESSRKALGPNDPRTAMAMTQLAMCLIPQEKWRDAEASLRASLAVREKNEPDAWSTFNTRSLLGNCLLKQKKYAEAEPLILEGHSGMKARIDQIPPPVRNRVAEAGDLVVKLYEAWGKPEKVNEWRAKQKSE